MHTKDTRNLSLATLLFFSILLLLSIPVSAQRTDSLSRELTVVSDHEAIIDPQKPLEPNYQFDNPKVTQLKPTAPRPTGDFTPRITIPRHPLLSPRASVPNYPSKIGFVALQGGVGPNLQMDAGLNIPLNAHSSFVLDASHRSSWNWSSYSNGTKSRVNRHLSEGTLGYLYHTASDQLEIGTSFAHDRYNYFGIYRPGLNPETEVGKRHTSPLEADEFYAQLALDYQKESDPWKFHLALHSDYTHLTPRLREESLPHSPASNRFNLLLQGAFDHRLSSLWYIGIQSESALATNGSNAYGIAAAYYKNEFLLNKDFFFYSQLITPYIGIDGYIGAYPWHLQIGANLGISGSVYDNGNPLAIQATPRKFRLSPYLDGYLTFNKYLSLYAKAGGGVHIPDRFGDDLYNRFFAPGFPLKPEWKKLHAELGLLLNAGYGISLQLSGGYSQLEGKNFATPRLLTLSGRESYTPPYIAFLPYQEDSRLLYGKFTMSYNLHDKFTLKGSLTYRHYTLQKKSVYPEGVVPLEASFSLLYKPTKSLSLYTDLFLGYGVQHTSPTTPTLKEKNLAFGRVLFGANYRINSYFALHGSLGNSCFIVRTFPYAYHDRYFPAAFLLGGSILF